MTFTTREMAERTEDAYSFNRYSESGWRGAVKELRKHIKDERGIEAWLRSKHMRWASDNCDRGYGKHNGSTVAEYIERFPKTVSDKEICELIEGTF